MFQIQLPTHVGIAPEDLVTQQFCLRGLLSHTYSPYISNFMTKMYCEYRQDFEYSVRSYHSQMRGYQICRILRIYLCFPTNKKHYHAQYCTLKTSSLL